MHWESLLILSILLWIAFPTCKMSRPEEDANGDKRLEKRHCMRSELTSRVNTCKCGVANTGKDQNSRVINGDIVEPINKYPWMISLEKNKRQYCGASILTPSCILTAAHCLIKTADKMVSNNCFKLKDGEKYCSEPLHKLSLRYFGPGGKTEKYASISSVIFDVRFSQPTHNYDIALIRTAKALPCSRFTAPICLPTEGDGLYSANTMVTLAGWGFTKVGGKVDSSSKRLREANLTIADDEKSCKKKVEAEHFCTLGKSQNSCHGDSGGPVFKEHKGLNYVIGLSSHGTTTDCNHNSSEFFTKVHEYLPWINKHMDPKSKLGPDDKEIKE